MGKQCIQGNVCLQRKTEALVYTITRHISIFQFHEDSGTKLLPTLGYSGRTYTDSKFGKMPESICLVDL